MPRRSLLAYPTWLASMNESGKNILVQQTEEKKIERKKRNEMVDKKNLKKDPHKKLVEVAKGDTWLNYPTIQCSIDKNET